ncbi:hypothetical protein [uncultured Marinobacter sp.]|uniref:hypothetical protein n=1 Tax=uncultured Marinobacter sp. TaxID=187379 RepID=UPI0030D8DB4B
MLALIPGNKLDSPLDMLRFHVDVDASGFSIVGEKIPIAHIGNSGNGVKQTQKSNGNRLALWCP